jgi:hypothetical protein
MRYGLIQQGNREHSVAGNLMRLPCDSQGRSKQRPLSKISNHQFAFLNRRVGPKTQARRPIVLGAPSSRLLFMRSCEKCTFLINLRRGGYPPCHSTSILKELFDSIPWSDPRIDPEIALNRGRIASKPAVDLHPCSFLLDCGFYSLVNTANRLSVAAVSRLRVVKERFSFRLGGA